MRSQPRPVKSSTLTVKMDEILKLASEYPEITVDDLVLAFNMTPEGAEHDLRWMTQRGWLRQSVVRTETGMFAYFAWKLS